MALYKITRGLDLPISGEPEQKVYIAPQPRHVALLAEDCIGMRPTMQVKVGDPVKRGQTLFTDKKNHAVRYTAPGAGTVAAINRGERRAFQSVVIKLNEREQAGTSSQEDEISFESFTGNEPPGLSSDDIKSLLVESGLWTAFRTRPFSKVPDPATSPHSIFVTAMDTNPLAPSVDEIIKSKEADFQRGLLCVAKLTEGPTYLSTKPNSAVTVAPHTGVLLAEFDGVHPAGNVGVHIHYLDPVHRDKTVWHLNCQDVIAVGRLFRTGKLDVERVISLAGPAVKNPRLFQTRLGASTGDLVEGELQDGENRVISGSVVSGRTAMGEVFGYLGRYHQQISALREGREREFLGWLAPGKDKFSVISVFISMFFPNKKFEFTTSTNGAERAMVPIGLYERVTPMDVMPTFLLRALAVGDIERAERLGCLELDEEDLALCTFVCPSKYDYGPILRQNLTQIEKEG